VSCESSSASEDIEDIRIVARALREGPSEVAMRLFLANVILSSALLFPVMGTAQVYQVRTPVPDVTAAAANWQINAEPIVVQGLVYYPTREQRMFDGQVMMQVDVYDHVPVYADATLEPYSVVYVPVGRAQMRMDERKREGELA